MTSLKRIWSDKRLTLDTKLRIYQTLVYYTPQTPGPYYQLMPGLWMLPPEVSETAWNPMVQPSPK